MEQDNRVIVLIDMDCFYCQVEEKLDPELKGKPIAVVQYNPWKGGGIIAVNYVARAMGVTRHMRGDEAKEKCPEIQLPSVPCQRGKADISKYREAGKEVARVLQRYTPLLERASIDEAYLDITAAVETRLKTLNISTITPSLIPNTFALGYESIAALISDVHSSGGIDCLEFDTEHNAKLLVGAIIVSEIRARVFEETGYTCSAGVAHNKILAKLVCGMNKPNKQTVLPKHCVGLLYKTLPLKKVKHLGGKFGDAVCQQLKITLMGDLQRFTEKHLQDTFDEKNGTWLYNIARGIDCEKVQARFNPKSIGCCKQFRGKSALLELDTLRKWLQDLGQEIDDRLDKDALENNRTPKQMVVSFATQSEGRDTRDVSSSRSYNFTSDDQLGAELFSSKALELLLDTSERGQYREGESNRKLKTPITFLGISVGKFEDNDMKKTKKILDYFAAGPANLNITKNKENESEHDTKNRVVKKSEGKDYIMKKFFQVTDKSANVNNKDSGTKNHDTLNDVPDASKSNVETSNNKNLTLNADLDKQESFFAKLLKKDENSMSRPSSALSECLENVLPTTPNCDIVAHGENSNDTEYSGSTINLEIDKSIALFEDEPDDVARVSSMRELINKSTMNSRSDNSDDSVVERSSDVSVTLNVPKTKDLKTVSSNKTTTDKNKVAELTNTVTDMVNSEITRNPSPQTVDHFECPECRKVVSMKNVDEHADYHLALKLREEERQHVRQENRERLSKVVKKDDKISNNEPKKKREELRNDSVGSISSFLVKIDEKTPTETCVECGKKVPVEKYAEHLDFHEAQKLNRELNKRPAPSYFAGSGVKKRKTVLPVTKTKINSSKSIDSFFK